MDRTEAAKQRLQNRVKRLVRLVELDAPATLLIREIKLVEDACWLLDEHSSAEGLAALQRDRVRHAAGFCVEESCTAQATDYYCEAHQPKDAGLDPTTVEDEPLEDN